MTAALLRLNRRTFASLKHRNYRLFFVGQVTSVTGTWMQNVAMAWLVLELTGSPVAVGILVLCQFLPFSVLGLFAGVFADRLDPRRLVIATQAAAMVTATALALVTLLGDAQPWHVYVLAVIRGIVLVFDAPARQAFTYQMVGPAELPNAIALNSSLFNAARVVGPAIGGVIVAAFGAGFCFAANAVSFLAVLLALLAMNTHELVSLKRDGPRPAIFAGTWEAIRYARRSRRVGIVLLLVCAVSTFAFNFNVLLPVLAGETLEAGTRGLRDPQRDVRCRCARGRVALRDDRTRELQAAASGNGRLWTRRARARARADARRGRRPASSRPGSASRCGTRTRMRLFSCAFPTQSVDACSGLYFYAFLGLQPVGGDPVRLARRRGRDGPRVRRRRRGHPGRDRRRSRQAR